MNIDQIMRAVSEIEAFFMGLSDGSVDEEDMQVISAAYLIGRGELEEILEEEIGNDPGAVAGILEAIDYLWAKLMDRAAEALQKELDDPGRAQMAADIAFAIGMAKNILWWRLSRR